MEQKYLWELSVRRNSLGGEAKTRLLKIPVEERAKSYKILNGHNTYRQTILKSEILVTFTDCYYSPTIYGEHEEDIPKMYNELEILLESKEKFYIEKAHEIKNMLNSVKELRENKNGKEN